MEVESGENSQLFVDVTPDKDGGVLKTLVRSGDGSDTPFNGCTVHVHYVGRLPSGEKFDSSRDRNEVFTFQVGKNAVIKGWEYAVVTMCKNEICEIKVSPQYAYGKEGFPPKIPANSTLIFEIELLSWEHEDVTGDGGVTKRIIKEGDGISKPNLDATVKCHLRGTVNGNLFDERDVQFIVGDGQDQDIVSGIEKAIVKMRVHERAKILIKPSYGFGENGHEEFGIPPNTDIEYEVCLFSFDKALELYEMDFEQKLDKANFLKERGTKYYRKGDIAKAIEDYSRLLKYVQVNEQDSDYPKALPLLISGTSNLAMCHLKMKDYHNAITFCHKVLAVDPDNVKAHYRLGEAYCGSKDYEHAIEYFNNVLRIEADNTAAKKQLIRAKSLLSKQVNAEKKLYSNIFSKLSE